MNSRGNVAESFLMSVTSNQWKYLNKISIGWKFLNKISIGLNFSTPSSGKFVEMSGINAICALIVQNMATFTEGKRLK